MTSLLRKRMNEDMLLNGLSESTRETYIYAVQAISRYYGKSPKYLSSEEIRKYFVYLGMVKKVSQSTLIVYKCALRFLYEKILGRSLPVFKLITKRKNKRIPAVLTKREVSLLLRNVRMPSTRMCLTTMYACGLRVSEARSLLVSDIDSERQIIAVRCGKGQKDREVPLPAKLLERLRQYWRQCRPKELLFPGRNGKDEFNRTTLAKTLRVVARRVGITKRVSPHVLRHSYAVHLLKAGVGLHVLQALLGHERLSSTLPYLRGYNLTQAELSPIVETAVAEL